MIIEEDAYDIIIIYLQHIILRIDITTIKNNVKDIAVNVQRVPLKYVDFKVFIQQLVLVILYTQRSFLYRI